LQIANGKSRVTYRKLQTLYVHSKSSAICNLKSAIAERLRGVEQRLQLAGGIELWQNVFPASVGFGDHAVPTGVD
jgi:hypothetical protein